MKRIIAALSGKVEKMKMDRKINRVNRAIETAVDNAQDEFERIEEKKSNLLASLSTDSADTNTVISSISDLIGQQEDQQAIIARLDKVKKYMNEDIIVEGEN